MKKYMELPADYAVLSDDEMTYTTGGSAVGGVVTIVGVAVLASSYVWGISQARDWLSVDSNRRGNPVSFPCGFSGTSIFRQTGAHRAVLGYCS